MSAAEAFLLGKEIISKILSLPNSRAASSRYREAVLCRTANYMRHIDIDSRSEEELIELNHKVVARLRFLHHMRSHSAMLGFRIGERVKFHPGGGRVVFGILTRYNKKTATVVTDSGENCNVAPGLLCKVQGRFRERLGRVMMGSRNSRIARLRNNKGRKRVPGGLLQ